MNRLIIRLPAIIGALPVTLANGTTADAAQVMSDLSWIVNQTNANAADAALVALKAANNNFTAVQSGLAATAQAHFPIASQVQNSAFMTLSSTLGTNTITARVATLALGAYTTNQIFTFIPSQTNSGASTLNVNGVGPLAIQAFGSALSGGELKAGVPATVIHNGSNFQLPSSGGGAIPGELKAYAGATTPSGYLLCDGKPASRTAFSALFAAIGTSWGAGDGSTTFNVPDLRGRGLFGRDDMGGTAANRITNAVSGITGTTLGATGGAQSVIITTGELPAHTHTGLGLVRVADGGGGNTGIVTGTTNTLGGNTDMNLYMDPVSSGSGGAVNKMPPTAIVNWVIKF